MLHKKITYTNFDGIEETVDAYFNLTKAECVDLNLEYEDDGGLVGRLKKLIKDSEGGEIKQKPAVDFVKLMIEKSYGVRPKDNPSLFLKEDDDGKPLFRKFKQTAAYSHYLYALLSGEESLDEFAENVMPVMTKEQKEAAQKMMQEEGLGNLVQLPTQG
jgi:hypothetical protein